MHDRDSYSDSERPGSPRRRKQREGTAISLRPLRLRGDHSCFDLLTGEWVEETKLTGPDTPMRLGSRGKIVQRDWRRLFGLPH